MLSRRAAGGGGKPTVLNRLPRKRVVVALRPDLRLSNARRPGTIATVRWQSIAFTIAPLLALACSSDPPAGGDDDDDAGGGATGGTSPSGGAAGSGLSASSGAAGASTGGTATNGGSSSGGLAGTPSAGSSGSSSSGGASGSTGAGGSGASGTGEWRCAVIGESDTSCACAKVFDYYPLSACDGSWSCCAYYVSVQAGVAYDYCICRSVTEAECTTWVSDLAASSQGRREVNCPP
jgi:hypothetical protein